jgi:chromosome segregation ATPase
VENIDTIRKKNAELENGLNAKNYELESLKAQIATGKSG